MPLSDFATGSNLRNSPRLKIDDWPRFRHTMSAAGLASATQAAKSEGVESVLNLGPGLPDPLQLDARRKLDIESQPGLPHLATGEYSSRKESGRVLKIRAFG